MKENEILINTSRGAVIDEAALIEHCRTHPNLRAGLDVFEDEPKLKPGSVSYTHLTLPTTPYV